MASTPEPSEPRPRRSSAPLVPLALAVAAGVVLDRHGWAGSTSAWAAVALGAVGLAFVCLRRRPAPASLALLVAWMALGAGWHHHRWSDVPREDLSRRVSTQPTLAWLRGVVDDVPTLRPGFRPGEPGLTRAVLTVSGFCDGERWHTAAGQVQLLATGDRTDLRAGDPVEAAGMLSALPGPLNPGEFDYRAYLRAQGVRLRLSVGDTQSVWPAGDARSSATTWRTLSQAWTRWLGWARAWSHAKLVGGLNPAVAPLAAALLLGRREAVEPEVNDAFARTGTTHLLAISGLHLQVLAGVIWMLCRAVGMRRQASLWTVALVTVGYALLVGLAPSVVRSAAMTVTICIGSMRDRTARPANVLALAALVTMLLNPAHLFDVGCQLSFLAVAAIAWGVPPALRVLERPLSLLDRVALQHEPRWRTLARQWQSRLVQGVVVSAVVWLVTLPLVALRFHVVSPISVLLNLPLIPITSLALLAAGVALVLAGLYAPLAAPASFACAGLLSLTERIVRWGSAQPWGHIFEPGPPWWWVAAFYAALAVVAVGSAARRRAWKIGWSALGGWVALGLVLAISPQRPGRLEADVLAVGHGLAVVVQTADGRAVVYDCGRMGDPSVGRRVIAPALWSRGVRRLDAVVLSHADADHYNGLPDLLARFTVAAVRVPPGFAGARNPGAARLLDDVRRRGIPIEVMSAGDRWPIAPEVAATALHPARSARPGASDNDRSLTLRVESGGRALLLTGDLELAGLAELIAQPATARGQALDVLVAPHHGGRTASPEWFFDWANPRAVVVSQRRPAAGLGDALAALEARGIPIWRTWERGAIHLRWQAAGITVRGHTEDDVGLTTGPGRLALVPTSFQAPAAARPPGWVRALLAASGLVVGLAACGVLAVMEWGAWILVRPGRKLRSGEPEPSPWEVMTIEARDGVILSGAWRPADPPSGRTAVILHGFLEDRAAMRGRAEALVPDGWNVLLPDARGHGQSGGHHASFGAREADDLRAWLDALAARGPSTCAAWGRSMGAAVALRAAAADPRLAALVLEAPYPDLESAVEGWLGRMRVPRRLAVLIVHRAAALAGVSLSRPRPVDLAPAVGVPTLVLHGSDDPIVPVADAHRLAASFPRPADVVEIPGARHVDVLEAGGSALVARIVAFLAAVPTPQSLPATPAPPG